jgi:hypothetical protein
MPSRALDIRDPIELLEQAEVLRRRAEQSFGEYALEAGRLLIAAKRRLPHGSWAQHISEHTGFSLRTAEVYMRARKRYDQLPQAEKQTVLEQPFTRSLLVLAQAPKQQADNPAALPEKGRREPLPPRGVPENGSSQAVEDFLSDRGLDTTQLIEASSTYHPDITQPDFTPEPTPFDDIEAGDGLSQQAINAEQLQEYEAAIAEVERLERENRELRANLESAQRANPGTQARGWDFVANLYQYLRADEPARSPESLARRASTIQGGPEIVAYLEQFFGATRNHIRLGQGEALPA